MGILDSLKSLFAGKAKDVAKKLGLDEKTLALIEGLVSKLEGLLAEGKLADAAKDALAAFKPSLAQAKSKEISVEDFTEKTKGFVGSLDGIELPEEISGLLGKVTGLLGK